MLKIKPILMESFKTWLLAVQSFLMESFRKWGWTGVERLFPPFASFCAFLAAELCENIATNAALLLARQRRSSDRLTEFGAAISVSLLSAASFFARLKCDVPM